MEKVINLNYIFIYIEIYKKSLIKNRKYILEFKLIFLTEISQ